MSAEPETKRLVREILEGVEEGGAASLTSVVRKAARLAALCDMPEYELLFNLHLAGIAKDRGPLPSGAIWKDRTRQPKWDVSKALIGDRTVGGGQVLGVPLESMDALLQQVQDGRRSGTAPAEVLEIELSLVSVLNRIRARTAHFATELQKQYIAAEQARSQTETHSGDTKIPPSTIFIGHGRSNTWMLLKDFLQDRLKLQWDEFNREPPAGITTKERLEDMLAKARFAFIVMTAEDEHPDGTMHARENVIHEAGLFQGRLGFGRAILLVEEGCAEFSNIHGLTQIRFPKGNIIAASEEIRRTLEREGILSEGLERT